MPAPRHAQSFIARTGARRPARWSASLVAAGLVLVLTGAQAVAQQADDPVTAVAPEPAEAVPLRLTVEELMTRVVALSPLIDIAEANIAAAGFRRLEARFAAYPAFGVRAGVAPAPRISVDLNEDGQPILSQDTRTEAELLSELVSLAWSADVTVTVPITTFGRIRIARQLADVGIDVAELQRDAAVASSRFEAYRALLVLQWYRPVRALLVEAEERLDDAAEELEWQIDDGDFAARGALRELTIGRTEFVSLRAEADAVATLARHALLTSLNLPDDFTVDSLDDGTPTADIPSLARVLDLARDARPDFRMLDAAVHAAELQRRLRVREFTPSLGFIADVTMRYAPTVTDLSGPFVYDPYNRFSPGLALGLSWNVNMFAQVARVRRADAQVATAEASREAAWMGIELEITEAYLDAVGKRDIFLSYVSALRAADAWLDQASFQYDQGLADFEDLSEPLRTYYQTAGGYWKAVLDYRIAVANLSLKCGLEALDVWPGDASGHE